MSEFVKEIGDAEFQASIQNGLVLVDFWAPWCGPCQMMAPVLDKVAQQSPDAKFFKVDVDSNTACATALGVQSIPTFVLFKNAIEVDRLIGAHPEEEVIALLKKHQ